MTVQKLNQKNSCQYPLTILCSLRNSAAFSSAPPPISPMSTMPSVSGSLRKTSKQSTKLVPLKGSPPIPIIILKKSYVLMDYFGLHIHKFIPLLLMYHNVETWMDYVIMQSVPNMRTCYAFAILVWEISQLTWMSVYQHARHTNHMHYSCCTWAAIRFAQPWLDHYQYTITKVPLSCTYNESILVPKSYLVPGLSHAEAESP